VELREARKRIMQEQLALKLILFNTSSALRGKGEYRFKLSNVDL
jgi:hypothetical protein